MKKSVSILAAALQIAAWNGAIQKNDGCRAELPVAVRFPERVARVRELFAEGEKHVQQNDRDLHLAQWVNWNNWPNWGNWNNWPNWNNWASWLKY
jgi:hypothetical protein